jgi:N-acetylneuraminic acid mutarotase
MTLEGEVSASDDRVSLSSPLASVGRGEQPELAGGAAMSTVTQLSVRLRLLPKAGFSKRWLVSGGLFAAVALAPTPTHAGVGSWTPMSTTSAPEGRTDHTAVWTGSKMIVWGGAGLGRELNTGGVYDAVTDTWTPTSTVGAPTGRTNHRAVWTGTKMIVWGGFGPPGGWLSTGGLYNPATDTWTPTSTTNSPTARDGHTAVWTGSEMIVWGGADGGMPHANTGAVYDPVTDTWTPTSTVNAPAGRVDHTAIWTGTKMIVWGGNEFSGQYVDTGGVYDPATDTWTAMSTTNAPTARVHHTAIWTGTRMIVWGGYDTRVPSLNTGGVYDPISDTWTPTSTTTAPAARYGHSALWTGSRMVVWGGGDGSPAPTGGMYDPVTDTWTGIATDAAPSERSNHSAVWTGTNMIVWGGFRGSDANWYKDTGGIYEMVGSDRGDFNADGRTDLLWHNQSTGQLYAWLMNGTTASSGRSLMPPSVNPAWQVRGIGDLDGDHRSDLLWRNESTGALYAWLMDGTTSSDGRYLSPSSVSPVWQAQGLADFDGDGKADILWRNRSTGRLYVWFMNGTSLSASSGAFLSPSSVADSAWQIRGLVDFDRDGKVDILWHNQATGQLYLWLMDGVTAVSAAYFHYWSVPNVAWQVAQVADFSGDGLPDILWRDQSTGELYVWVMDRWWIISGRFLTPSAVSDLKWQVVPQ